MPSIRSNSCCSSGSNSFPRSARTSWHRPHFKKMLSTMALATVDACLSRIGTHTPVAEFAESIYSSEHILVASRNTMRPSQIKAPALTRGPDQHRVEPGLMWGCPAMERLAFRTAPDKDIQIATPRKPHLLINVDVSASTAAFLGTVCLIAVRRSVSGRTGCRRCGRVGKTPRLCSSTCLAPSWYVSPP